MLRSWNPLLVISRPKKEIVASGLVGKYSWILKINGDPIIKRIIMDSIKNLFRTLLTFFLELLSISITFIYPERKKGRNMSQP